MRLSESSPFGASFECADDLMQAAVETVLNSSDTFLANRGEGREVFGASYRLTNARARLSRSEKRGKVFSALGELFWCLAASDSLEFIKHYIPHYGQESEDGKTVYGAYGPRIFGAEHLNQVQNVVTLLRKHPSSRRGVLQLYSSQDISDTSRRRKEIPCTCTLQCILRNGKLHLLAYMRSNDAYWGLPHDIFLFTMLQEIIARALNVDVGFYQHMVGNLHLYDKKFEDAQAYLSEEYQSITPMRPMPDGDPFSVIPELLAAESAIRMDPRADCPSSLHPYWADILRLIRVHSECHYRHEGYQNRIAAIKSQMADPAFDVYLDAKS